MDTAKDRTLILYDCYDNLCRLFTRCGCLNKYVRSAPCFAVLLYTPQKLFKASDRKGKFSKKTGGFKRQRQPSIIPPHQLVYDP
jgi:hypothetical protein